MNIHHLELFYYVARFGGIREAVRHMPYGIQQPAVSGQISQLEDYLGAQLFQRRPFRLTSQGEELFAFIQPFFENLDHVAKQIQGHPKEVVRLAASNVILRDYLPQSLTTLRQQHPDFRLSLREGTQSEIERWLENREIDLGVTLVVGKPPSGIKVERFLELSLALLVPTSSKFTSADEILNQDRIREKLIGLPENEALRKTFQHGLNQRGIDWPATIEVNSLDLVEAYTRYDFGIGLSVNLPLRNDDAPIRTLPLNDFAKVTIGAMWRDELPQITKALLAELRNRARELQSI